MFGHKLAQAAMTAHRTLAGPFLATALALASLWSPTPAGVEAAPAAVEPSARLQIVIKSVTIHDDRDSVLRGVGEIWMVMEVWHCNEGVPLPCDPEKDGGYVVFAEEEFQASSGRTVTMDRPLPRNGDRMRGGGTAEQYGFAVLDGRHYILQISMMELDGLIPPRFDQMGEFFHVIDTTKHGLGLGTHTKRPFMEEQLRWGDFTVTYEIRRAPLPDLRPIDITVSDLPGRPEKRVCTAVQNAEDGQADAFEVVFRVDGIMPGGGRTAALAPTRGNHVDVCLDLALPTSGRHTLSAHVDEPRDVVEFDESNNAYEKIYEPSGPSVAPTPSTSPSAAQPDVAVTAVKVNGRVPDGKDDCRAGKNDVAVVVKNAGAAPAGEFVVGLAVDGGATVERKVASLDAGKEREIRFEDVPLKKGERQLQAAADWKTDIAESNEANNARTVTASCKGDD